MLSKYLQDASILRRLLFAVDFLSPELPMYWEVITLLDFATKGQVPKSSVTPNQERFLMENLQTFNASAFAIDT